MLISVASVYSKQTIKLVMFTFSERPAKVSCRHCYHCRLFTERHNVPEREVRLAHCTHSYGTTDYFTSLSRIHFKLHFHLFLQQPKFQWTRQYNTAAFLARQNSTQDTKNALYGKINFSLLSLPYVFLSLFLSILITIHFLSYFPSILLFLPFTFHLFSCP